MTSQRSNVDKLQKELRSAKRVMRFCVWIVVLFALFATVFLSVFSDVWQVPDTRLFLVVGSIIAAFVVVVLCVIWTVYFFDVRNIERQLTPKQR